MRNPVIIVLVYCLISCNGNQTNTEKGINNLRNATEELESIEKTRINFENAIAEKRYHDLVKYATPDLISLTPICGEWEEFKKLTETPKGLFSYDSIRMKPEETIILNDSIAYDFGTSSSFYTNPEGRVVKIRASFLAILKKDKKDGVWKLHREVATTNIND